MVIAIISNGVASGKIQKNEEDKKSNRKGIVIAIVAGILMALFYRFVVMGMDINNFKNPVAGMLTPYSAIFIFSLGVFFSNFIFNTFLMKHSFVGESIRPKEYFKGSFSTHLSGILGGAIWGLGSAFSYIASGQAGAAVSYALGRGLR